MAGRDGGRVGPLLAEWKDKWACDGRRNGAEEERMDGEMDEYVDVWWLGDRGVDGGGVNGCG